MVYHYSSSKMIIYVLRVSVERNQRRAIPLELLHIELCGPLTVESLHHKKYILVIVDDFTRFTWVFCLRLKSETASELINFIKGIDPLIKLPVRLIRSDNGTEFTNWHNRELPH